MANRYVKERDEAFLSLDKQKIMKFCRRWHICLPDNETVFWCGVHKVVANTASATEEQRAKSIDWLKDHGFSPEIYRKEEC